MSGDSVEFVTLEEGLDFDDDTFITFYLIMNQIPNPISVIPIITAQGSERE
jgi:hypothetical protein